MKDNNAWRSQFRDRRVSYGVTQEHIAIVAGISRSYLTQIENGSLVADEELQARLDYALDGFDVDQPIRVLVDYMRMRFPTQDVQYVIEQVMKLRHKYMAFEETGFYGYPNTYSFGDIYVMTDPGDTKKARDRGTIIELKGQGCRQFEGILQAQGRSWYDFFHHGLAHHGIMKRLDLAVDDRVGILSVSELGAKCGTDQCDTTYRTFRWYQSGDVWPASVVKSEKGSDPFRFMGMGHTFYLGSPKSKHHFCVYQKDYEQYKKNGIPIEEADVKNRFELRMRDERAEAAVEHLLNCGNAAETAFGLINNSLTFFDEKSDCDPSEWPLNPRWELFTSGWAEALKLSMKPEKYTLERSYRWLTNQVAPTLKMLMMMDVINDSDRVNDIIQGAKISPKHQSILKQLELPVDEVILPNLSPWG